MQITKRFSRWVKNSLRAVCLTLAVCFGWMPSIGHAVNYTWDASGGAPADDGSGTWSSSGGTNWLTGSTYGAWGNTTSDVAFFGVGSGAAGTVTVSGSVTTNGITFNNAGSGNYTLSGGTIGFGGTTPTITVNATGTSSIASLLSSTVTLVKAGAGTLSFSGVGSTLSGGFTQNAGVIINSGSMNTGSAANTGNVTISTGTYFNQGFHRFVGSLAVSSGAGFVNSGTTTMNASGSFLQFGGTASGQNTGTMTMDFFRLNGSSTTAPATFVNGTNGAMTINTFILGNGGFGSFTNDGGRLTVNSGQFSIGKGGGTATGTSSLTVNSGTVTNNNSTTFRLGDYSNGSNTTATVNLNGGLFETVGSLAQVTSSGSNNAAFVNFNGGTLRGLTNSGTLLASSLTGVTFAAGGGTIDLASGITSTAAANFSGVGGFTKSGSGTLILTGSNNTNAGTNGVSGGILQVGDGSSLAGSLSGNIVLSNTTTLAFNSTANQVYAGVISGTGLLTKTGAGSTVTLSGNGSVVNGGITINSGAILNTGSLSTGSAANTGNVAVNSGTYTNQGRHTFVGSLAVASGASVANSGTMTMGVNSFMQFSGTSSGQNTGTMNVDFFRLNGSSSGAVTAFANNANGVMTINSFIIGETGYSSFTNDGGRLTVGGGQFTVGRSGGTDSGTSTLTVNSGTITNNNSSSFRLGNYANGSNTAAVVNLNGGLFETVGSLALVASSGSNNSATINFNGGTLRGLTNGATLLASNLTGVTFAAGGGTIDLASGITSTAAASLTGVGGLTKSGSGTLILTSVGNSYAGNSSVAAGILQIGDGSSLAGSLPGNVTLSNTTTLAFNSTANQAYAGVISGTGILTKSGAGGVLTLSGNGSVIRSGITLSSGALVNTGSLSTGSAGNTGNVVVTSGTYTNQGVHNLVGSLSVDPGASVVNSGTMTMGAGSFFQINGTGAGQNTGTMNVNFFRLNGGADAVPTIFANDANGAMTIDSFILGDGGFGAFTNNGGRLTVTNNFGQFSVGRATGSTTGTSTFTVASGTVTVNADGTNSTFRLGAWGSASNTAGVINLNGGLFETVAGIAKATSSGTNNSAFVNFAGGTLRGLTNGATLLNSNLTGVALNAGGGTIDLGVGITNTIAAAMSGAGGLTKTGSGVLQLTGGNTYAGLTNIDAGTLRVNGLLGVGGVSVASNAILAGSGTIGGAVSVLAGGIVGPGNSPGTLTVNDAFSLAGTSILDFELNAGDTTPGGGINDLITGVTNLTLGGFLDITGSGDWTTLSPGASWRLFNYSGTLTDNGLTIRTAPTLAAGQSLQISTATANQVNVIVVPEPGAIALAGLGAALAGWMTIRRRR